MKLFNFFNFFESHFILPHFFLMFKYKIFELNYFPFSKIFNSFFISIFLPNYFDPIVFRKFSKIVKFLNFWIKICIPIWNLKLSKFLDFGANFQNVYINFFSNHNLFSVLNFSKASFFQIVEYSYNLSLIISNYFN